MSDASQTTGGNASPEPVIQWGKLKVCPPFALHTHDVPASSIGNVFSLIVPNLKLNLQNDAQPLHATATASFRIPVTPPADGIFLGYKTDIRGFVSTTAGTRAVLYVDIAGSSSVFEFPFGDAFTGDFGRDLFSLQRSDVGGDFAAHPVTPFLTITLLLSVERLTGGDPVVLELDTIDILAVFNGRTGSAAGDQVDSPPATSAAAMKGAL